MMSRTKFLPESAPFSALPKIAQSFKGLFTPNTITHTRTQAQVESVFARLLNLRASTDLIRLFLLEAPARKDRPWKIFPLSKVRLGFFCIRPQILMSALLIPTFLSIIRQSQILQLSAAFFYIRCRLSSQDVPFKAQK